MTNQSVMFCHLCHPFPAKYYFFVVGQIKVGGKKSLFLSPDKASVIIQFPLCVCVYIYIYQSMQ